MSSTAGSSELIVDTTADAGGHWSGAGSLPVGGPTNLPNVAPTAARVQLQPDGSWTVLIRIPSSAAFNRAELFRSTNRGETWNGSIAAGYGEVTFAKDAVFATGGTLNGQLYTSPDDGRTWKQIPLPGPGAPDLRLQGIYSSPGVVTATGSLHTANGERAVDFTSSDGGRSFQVADAANGAAAISALAKDGSRWLVAPDLSRTTVRELAPRAPQSVDKAARPTESGAVVTLAALDSTTAFAIVSETVCTTPKNDCRESRTLLRTTDGGATWVPT